MQFMRNIVDDSEIDDDVQIAIEYNIPQTSKRVDFIILGTDAKDRENIVIVELKQWSKAEKVDDDMHFSVKTYVANSNGLSAIPPIKPIPIRGSWSTIPRPSTTGTSI